MGVEKALWTYSLIELSFPRAAQEENDSYFPVDTHSLFPRAATEGNYSDFPMSPIINKFRICRAFS